MNDGRHTRTTGTSKSAIDLTKVSPFLQPILSSNASSNSLDSDHCVITINIATRSREPHITITKFNTTKADSNLSTSNEVWKQTTKPSLLHSTEDSTESFDRTIKCTAESAVPITEITKHFLEPWGCSYLQMLRENREHFHRIYKKTKCNHDLILWEKNRPDFKRLVKKKRKLRKLCQFSQWHYIY